MSVCVLRVCMCMYSHVSTSVCMFPCDTKRFVIKDTLIEDAMINLASVCVRACVFACVRKRKHLKLNHIFIYQTYKQECNVQC